HIRLAFALLPALFLTTQATAAPPRADSFGDPLPEGALLRLGTVRLRHGDGVCAVAFAPDGKLLASISRDRTLRLWDAATGRQIRQLSEPDCEYYALAFSPDSRTLAAATGDPLRGGHTAVRLWDVTTGKERTRLKGHERGVLALAFSADGRRLASANPFEPVRIWDVQTGQTVVACEEPHGAMALAFSPDGCTLASACMSGTVRLW